MVGEDDEDQILRDKLRLDLSYDDKKRRLVERNQKLINKKYDCYC